MKTIFILFCGIVVLVSGLNNGKPIQSRIIGGDAASLNEYPWHATINSVFSGGREALCGGSLISPEWVLTSAGQCVNQAIFITIGLGSNNRLAPAITLNPIQAIVHERFSSFIENNIALLRLPSPVTLSANIQVIALPTRAQASNLYNNQRVRVSGFGAIENEDGITAGTEPSNQLMWVEKLVITNANCASFFWPLSLPSSILCAEGNFRVWFGVCEGDQGGALVWDDADGVPRQIGIVSFLHFLGCMGGRPDGYVRVTSFLDWISANTGIEIE